MFKALYEILLFMLLILILAYYALSTHSEGRYYETEKRGSIHNLGFRDGKLPAPKRTIEPLDLLQ